MKLVKINNEKVKPIPLEKDDRPIKGFEVSPDPYYNMFLLAPTFSGKTCALFHILKKIVGKNTNIAAFVATQNMDDSWKYIVKHFNKKGITIAIHDTIEEKGIDNLDELINYYKDERENQSSDQDDEYEPKYIKVDKKKS